MAGRQYLWLKPGERGDGLRRRGQFQVEMYGGPNTRYLPVSKSRTEFKFTVNTASPVISTRSRLRKNAT